MRHKNYKTESAIIDYIDSFYDKENRNPSLREIEAGTGISRQTVQRYLIALANNDAIKYDGKVIITKHISEQLNVPVIKLDLVGSVPCGEPMDEEEFDDGHIFFPRQLLGDGQYFILKASGDSMVNAGIDDQDLVIVQRQNYAEANQIVVALDEENRNTLKRLMYNGTRYYLHAENEIYDDIFPQEIKIQGVAVRVIKKIL